MEKTAKIVLLDIDDTLFNTEKLIKSDLTHFELYEEVHDVLEQLAPIVTLGILSQGQLAFQKKKLSETNITKYFEEEHTHIVEVKSEVFDEILGRYHGLQKVYFVEDRLDSLMHAKKADPSIIAIWMKRGRNLHSQTSHVPFTPDYEITSLAELVSIVSQT